MPYSRICIFGRPGSGKSTFSLKLAQKLNMPIYHLDKIFYVENWVERDRQEFLTLQRNMVDQDTWIIDGNSLQSLEMRYSRAEICIYFNMPRLLCLWRLLKRFFTKDKSIDDRAAGCYEALRLQLIKYMWTYEYRQNNRLVRLIHDLKMRYPHVRFIEISTAKDVDELFKIFGGA